MNAVLTRIRRCSTQDRTAGSQVKVTDRLATTDEERRPHIAAAEALCRMRQPRIRYDSETGLLAIAYSALFSRAPEFSNFLDTWIPAQLAVLGDASLEVSLLADPSRPVKFHCEIRSESELRLLCKCISLTATSCEYEISIWVTLDDVTLLSWCLEESWKAALGRTDWRCHISFHFEILELVLGDRIPITSTLSPHAIQCAKDIVAWLDVSGGDHATVLTAAGLGLVTSAAELRTPSIDTSFYGRPGNRHIPRDSAPEGSETPSVGDDGGDKWMELDVTSAPSSTECDGDCVLDAESPSIHEPRRFEPLVGKRTSPPDMNESRQRS
ncbi:uncharacterized protein LTR77_010984 [Saxophila tyrrhenica]|uniref:Uncharacterized protein n=1 Tax=Saxophila tyrrhenica TaxID=1690608 RepID=A0AAV9NTU2_9PEZI|nr:hypothetical protein LTR77_010984 [Saxophila tyrrhenica]